MYAPSCFQVKRSPIWFGLAFMGNASNIISPTTFINYKDLHCLLVFHFLLYLFFTSPNGLFALFGVARVCDPLFYRLAVWLAFTNHFWLSCLAFCMRQIAYRPLTCPYLSIALKLVIQINFFICYFVPYCRRCSSARRWFLFQPYWNTPFFDSVTLDLLASTILYQPLFHHHSADL